MKKLTALLFAAALFIAAAPAYARPAKLQTADAQGLINLRSAPTLQSNVITQLPADSVVNVLRHVPIATEGYVWNYVKISNGQMGWIRYNLINYIASRARYGSIFTQDKDAYVNVRSGPSTAGSIVGKGQQGDVLQIVNTLPGDHGYKWHYVKFSAGKTPGWVREDLVNLWPM